MVKKVLSVFSCPHCTGNQIIKYGKFNNNQRYKCKECNKTFCDTTNTIYYYSKKSKDLWKRYICLLLSGGSIRLSAKLIKISVTSSFMWRHKILNGLEKSNDDTNLKDSVCMAKRMFYESYKGQKGRRECDKHWSQRKKIWVMFCGDNHNNALSLPTGLDRWDRKSFNKYILSKVEENAFINALSDSYVVNIAKKYNKKKKINKANESCMVVGNYIEAYRFFKKIYRGIASKYLSRYLSFIKLFAKEIKERSSYVIKLCRKASTYIKCKDLNKVKILN